MTKRPGRRLALAFLLATAACADFKASLDLDGDGFEAHEDCVDVATDIYPGAPELCDGRDNDCDGLVDEDAAEALTWYHDGDGDGYGATSDARRACEAPEGYVELRGDCDDTDPQVYPDEGCVGVHGTDTDPADAPDRWGTWVGPMSFDVFSAELGVMDTCHAVLRLVIDEALRPEIRGSAACAFVDDLAGYGKLGILVDGTVYDEGEVAGRVWLGDFAEDTWSGAFEGDRVLEGSMRGEATVLEVLATYEGEFRLTRAEAHTLP